MFLLPSSTRGLSISRATETARYGRYHLIEALYAQSADITEETLGEFNASELSLQDLHVQLTHKIQDFLLE